jgi:hypothetical protein
MLAYREKGRIYLFKEKYDVILRSMQSTQNIVIFTLCLVIAEVTTRLISTPHYRKV